MCRVLRLVLIRFPGRTFVFAGGSGHGTHEVARFCYRHRARLTLVSKLHPDANLFDPPPAYAGKGRPRVKGGRVAETEAGLTHYEGRSYAGLMRHQTLCLVVVGFAASHADRPRGE